jgi:hypothetical protein
MKTTQAWDGVDTAATNGGGGAGRGELQFPSHSKHIESVTKTNLSMLGGN